jgi:hypothetical protein
MEDQIAMTLSGIMEEVISIFTAEETGVHEGCASFSTREALIILSETINIEKRCRVCFRPTEEEIQYNSHPRSVLLTSHS